MTNFDETSSVQTTKTDLSALNDNQRDAVISENKRLLVLAGAGSGKTKTLLQKLIYLIEEKGVSPANILAITFTKNATTTTIESPFKLGNYPNPFINTTDITAFVPEGITNAEIVVNDITGREVARYNLSEGNNSITFSLNNADKGVMVFSLYISGKKIDSKTMLKAGN